MKKIILGFVAVSILYSCGGGNMQKDYEGDLLLEDTESEMGYINADKAPMSRQSLVVEYKNQELDVSIDKKIIKDARIGVEVKDYYLYRNTIDSIINSLGAYILNDDLNKNDYSINSSLTIRIPSKEFNELITNLEKGTQKLLYKKISARDVTEEFIDIEARLTIKKEVEKRYIQLLAKARNIKEILEVEEKLRILREEIEAKVGRLNYLKKQVSYSTVYLQINQKLDYKYEPSKEQNFFQRLIKSLDKGWKGFVSFLLFLFRIWPVVLIGMVIFFYIRRIRRKKRQLKKD